MTSEELRKVTTVAILGYGREGQSVHRFLLKAAPDAIISIVDKKTVTPIAGTAKSTKVFSGSDYLKGLEGNELLLRSPGIPLHLPEIDACAARGAKVSSLMNLFMARARDRVVGVSGTKGKSTTASMLHAILARTSADVRLVGNIGTPALDYLEDSGPDTVFVAELSSFQLEDLQYSPHRAVLLNIVPEHLDHHVTYDAYLEAKERLLSFQTEKDLAVLSPYASHMERSRRSGFARRFYYSSDPKHPASVTVRDGWVVHIDGSVERSIVPLAEIPLLGPGNLENVLAAVSVAVSFSVPEALMRSAIREFSPLEHRLEPVGEYNGIQFYNDSLATIPQATIQALQGLGSRVETLIAGGFDRGVDFAPLGKELASRLSHLKTIILFPSTGEKIWQQVKAFAPQVEVKPYFTQTMEEAVSLAYRYTSSGKICLLSPASSSFNLFRDYLERGECFKQWVRALGELPQACNAGTAKS